MVNPKSVDNLKSQATKTKEERKKIASMGGKARAKKKQEQKTMRDLLTALLDINCKSTEDKQVLKDFGSTDKTHKSRILVALIQRAEKTGDTKAIELICGMTGQPIETIVKTEDDMIGESTIEKIKDLEIKIIDGKVDVDDKD